MIAGVGRLTGNPGLFWHFVLEKLQSCCLLLTLEARAEVWGRKEENASQTPGAEQIPRHRKTQAVLAVLGTSLKANLANLRVWNLVGFAFIGVLSCCFSLAFIGESKQGYALGGAMEEATGMIIASQEWYVPQEECT